MNDRTSQSPLAHGMLAWLREPRPSNGALIFLDRDGVLNEHIQDGYVLDIADFRWIPGAIESSRRLVQSGSQIVVLTNQSCINRGLTTVARVTNIMSHMVTELEAAGVLCTGWICCPHRPDERCRCRKPGTAMLEWAAQELQHSLRAAVLIGDSPSDIEAAMRAGARGLLVDRNSPCSFSAAIEAILGET